MCVTLSTARPHGPSTALMLAGNMLIIINPRILFANMLAISVVRAKVGYCDICEFGVH